MWVAGVSYQLYVEQAAIVRILRLISPPFTVLVTPTTRDGHRRIVYGC